MNNLSFIQFIDTDNTQHTVPAHMIRLEHWRHDTDPDGCCVKVGSTHINVSQDTFNEIINALKKQYTITCCNAG